MTQASIPAYPRSRIILGCVFAVAAALATPFLAGFITTIIFPTIICTLLYGFGGLVPAALSMLLQVFVFGFIGGIEFGVIAALAIALPAAFIIREVRLRVPFFKMLSHSLAAQLLGILAALVAARIFYGADIIGNVAVMMRSMFETFLTPGFIDYMLDMVFDIDAVPDTLTEIQLFEGVLTAERRAEYLDGFVAQISATLRLTLPGTLLSACCLSGIIAAAWPAKLIDRRAYLSGAYVKLARWYTPWWISLGLIATWTVTWILEALGVNGADVMYLAVQALLLMAFRIQAAISLERRFTQLNMKPALRIFFILGLQLLMPADFVMFYGAFSALFGTTGASLQIRILRGKNKNDDTDN